MTAQPLDDYFAALERLKKNRPNIVPKGTKITNDAVALEAGRGKGSIKKSRPVFSDLIQTIDSAASEHDKHANQQKKLINKAKTSAEQSRRDLESALAREVSLLLELYEVKKKLARLTGEKVLPIRGKQAEV